MVGDHNRILIADSGEEVLRRLVYLLKADGYDVSISRSGQRALWLLRSSSYDLLLLGDYLVDGCWEELLQELRRPRIKTQCIVMYMAALEPEDVGSLCALGVYELVHKQRTNEIGESVKRFFAQEKYPANSHRRQVVAKNRALTRSAGPSRG